MISNAGPRSPQKVSSLLWTLGEPFKIPSAWTSNTWKDENSNKWESDAGCELIYMDRLAIFVRGCFVACKMPIYASVYISICLLHGTIIEKGLVWISTGNIDQTYHIIMTVINYLIFAGTTRSWNWKSFVANRTSWYHWAWSWWYREPDGYCRKTTDDFAQRLFPHN